MSWIKWWCDITDVTLMRLSNHRPLLFPWRLGSMKCPFKMVPFQRTFVKPPGKHHTWSAALSPSQSCLITLGKARSLLQMLVADPRRTMDVPYVHNYSRLFIQICMHRDVPGLRVNCPLINTCYMFWMFSLHNIQYPYYWLQASSGLFAEAIRIVGTPPLSKLGKQAPKGQLVKGPTRDM